MRNRRNHRPKPPSLFFAFIDGVFHYECRDCNALCCRGQGFAGNLKKEMGTLLDLYPALGGMAVGREGDIVSFATPSGACHFLDRDNHCRIEKEHGRSLKPGVCSLFPFNVFTRVGSVVAVTPHFMCPLRMEIPARRGEVAGTHRVLKNAVLASGLLSLAPDTEFAHAPQEAERILGREKSFRDSCSLALGKSTFRELLENHSRDGANLVSFVTRAAAVWGMGAIPQRVSRDGIDDLLIALASPLRMRFVSLGDEGILRILALGEVVLRRVASLSIAPPSVQGAFKIITSVEGVLRLLARGDSPIPLPRRTSSLHLKFSNPEMTMAAFQVVSEAHRKQGILTTLEASLSSSISPADRSVLLLQLSQKFELESAAHRKKQLAAGLR